MRFRALLVPLACAALGACAAQDAGDGLPDPGPALPPASFRGAPSAVDGLYKGSSTRYEANRRTCPHPGLVNLYVQDRQFTYRWDRATDIPASIGPDGSISGQAGDISLSGRQVGDTMEGDLTNGACALHFTTRRRFNGA
ncbi:MAG TPA: hypothetical protein VIJ55_03485 [Acetobacteraceae bacterium]